MKPVCSVYRNSKRGQCQAKCFAERCGRLKRTKFFFILVTWSRFGKHSRDRGVDVNFRETPSGRLVISPASLADVMGPLHARPKTWSGEAIRAPLLGRVELQANAAMAEAARFEPAPPIRVRIAGGSRGTRMLFTPNSAANASIAKRIGRVQMKMPVGVDVVQRQACCAEGLELGANLGKHLLSDMRQKKDRSARSCHVCVKTPLPIDKVRY